MFRIDRRLIQNFDWLSFSIVIVLTLLGILTIYSSTRHPADTAYSPFFIKQMIWLSIGLAALLIVMSFDYVWLGRLAVPLYVFGIFLLIVVLVMGRTGMGAQRWLSLGPMSFQPSEFFRLIFIIMVARYLSAVETSLDLPSMVRLFLMLALIPFVLLIKQPDLGTALVILIIFGAMTVAKGLKRKLIVFIIMVSIVSMPFLGNIFWTGLKDYQKNRIIAFMDPMADPAGIGYHINQSKVAIGSGKFFGKGFLHGTQGPFRFLPERHTDFIFAVFAEEWGFAGSVLLLLLYLTLILRGLDTARKAKDEFGRNLALGITFMFAVYFFINVGMTLGMTPVVGIPLPFMSYGGTALLSNFISIGVLMNIRTRRFSLFY